MLPAVSPAVSQESNLRAPYVSFSDPGESGSRGGFAEIFKASRYPNGALNKGSGSGMGGQDSDWQVGLIGQKASTVPPMLVPNGASTCHRDGH